MIFHCEVICNMYMYSAVHSTTHPVIFTSKITTLSPLWQAQPACMAKALLVFQTKRLLKQKISINKNVTYTSRMK